MGATLAGAFLVSTAVPEVTVQRGGSQVTVTIVDRCPACSDGDLYLSPAAFTKIAEGRVKVKWDFIWSNLGSPSPWTRSW